MRVVAGKARGHKLIAPAGITTRPTGDRMKEDLFNILSSRLAGARFLDLYCGSGAMGIEALSRRAASATFVDQSKAAISATTANLQKTGLIEDAEILYMSAEKALHKLDIFDIIFIDPPYDGDYNILLLLPPILADDGIVVVECPIEIECNATGLRLYRQKIYGKMQFMFFQKDFF